MIPLLFLAFQADPVFRADIDLIRVAVQVTHDNKSKSGLTKKDFLLLDQGSPQEIIAIETEAQPLDLIILVDVSNSMTPVLRQLKRKSAAALRQLRDGDRVGVLSFGTSLKIEHPLTQDFDAVHKAIRQIRGHRPGTELNSNIFEATEYFHKQARSSARRAILLFTDNHGDRGVPDSQVIDQLWSTDVILHSLIFEGKLPANPQPHVEVFSTATAGDIFRVDTQSLNLPSIFDLLRQRYTLIYRAPAALATGQARQIEVQPLNPPPGNPQIRKRTGYKPKLGNPVSK